MAAVLLSLAVFYLFMVLVSAIALWLTAPTARLWELGVAALLWPVLAVGAIASVLRAE